jgi:hypothetical protein
MIEEIKNKIENKLSGLKPISQVNDPIIKLLQIDHVGDISFESHLRILPYELVEQLGNHILQEQKEFKIHFQPEYDVFNQEWRSHLIKYWEDKLKLIETYTNTVEQLASPMSIVNNLFALMRKIERRAILLKPELKIVTQKHSRLSGEQKDYKVIRSYWVDERGDIKRLISRHIGNRYENLEKEIANLFYNRGFAVHWEYKSDKGYKYDLVVERDRMRSVVEIKMVNEDIFNPLFLFDELSKRFKQDYPNES